MPNVTERSRVGGIYFKVHHAPTEYRDLIGRKVYLRWSDRPDIQAYINQVKINVDFSQQAYQSMDRGIVHPIRLNHWRQVQVLESLAGARPNDDVMVTLTAVEVARKTETALYITREPILITGKYYALVTILELLPDNCAAVRHFNSVSGKFDGEKDVVCLPSVVPDRNGVLPATVNKIDESPQNQIGWYIYGAKNRLGIFTVQAIAPRALFQLQPQKIISGLSKTTRYIHYRYWQGVKQKKGQIDSIILNPRNLSESELINSFQKGDRLLLLHSYGGIGGNKQEFAPLNLFFGHFSFGLARVVREPFTKELQFKIGYAQVYTQNTTGIIAGSLDWTNYVGDRQFGWLGSRPITDIVVKLDVFEEYNFGGLRRFPLNALAYQLDRMMARYRTGDGTGATFVGGANSCVQDSCQALYLAIKMILSEIDNNPQIKTWLRTHPHHPQTERWQRLIKLNQEIETKLISWQTRPDWVDPYQSLIGTRLADRPVTTIVNALTSWRSLLPRLANDNLAEIFLKHGASLWLCNSFSSESFDSSGTKGLWLQSSVGTDYSGDSAEIAAAIQDSTTDGSIIPQLEGAQLSGYGTNNLLTPGLAFPPLPSEGETPPTTGVAGSYSLSPIEDTNLTLPRPGDTAVDGVITYHIGAGGELGYSIDLDNHSAITLGTGNETIVLHLDGGINITGGASSGSSIIITPGSKLIAYAHGEISLAGTSTANAVANSDTSDNAEIYLYTNDQVTISGGSGMKTFLHAPYSLLEMNGGANFAGTVWANEWKGVGTVNITQGDTKLLNTKVGSDLASYCYFPD